MVTSRLGRLAMTLIASLVILSMIWTAVRMW